ncbi:hypothetical protein [Namhaeicola litoreus]|uniref:Pectate lyase n=1 Tax=Namhaeicola litoreus TaxID=1052145 RepID=A0ABW3Y3B4_9FLAO
MIKTLIYLLTFFTASYVPSNLYAQATSESEKNKFFEFNVAGILVYKQDEKGNSLPDFSYVGYQAGEKALPTLPVKITIGPIEGDNTHNIQNALDILGNFPLDKNGHRGALLLKKGVYHVEGVIAINQSGIVLRGEGNGPDGTILIAKGYGDVKYKRTFIQVGNDDKIQLDKSSFQEIEDDFVPIGTHTFKVKSATSFKIGDRIVVFRPSTKNWITEIGCDTIESRWAGIRDIQWVKEKSSDNQSKFKKAGFYYQRLGYDSHYSILKNKNETWEEFQKRIPISEDGKSFDFTRQWEAGEYDLYFERQITHVKANQITIDAPIVHTLDAKFGGGGIFHFKTPTRISEVGIENLRLISEFSEPVSGHPYGAPEEQIKAEQHAWNGIVLNENTENTWVRDITGNYFGWSLVSAKGKKATIQDCVNLGHASKIDGGRRYPFMINGQLNLVQRCITFEGRHEFVNQEKTQGPNVFVDCIGFDSKQNSGPHHRYAVGNLYDNITSEKPMESRYRGKSGTGHGWAGTQTCFYNCVAPEFFVEAPPGGISWLIGSGSIKKNAKLEKPVSLYYQQVQDRLGKTALTYLLIEDQLKFMGEYRWVQNRLNVENKKYHKSIDVGTIPEEI